MDLLRAMRDNRKSTGMDLKPAKVKSDKQKSAEDDGLTPGTKLYRDFIIKKKPGKKKVKAHFQAIVEKEIESSDDDE
jgi:hypothetical protein